MIVTLVLSPEQPPLVVAGNLTITPAGPFGADHITVHVNAGLTEYGPSETLQLGEGTTNGMVTEANEHTRTLDFNLQDKKQYRIRIAGQSYGISLLSIGKAESEAPSARSFTFQVDEIDAKPEGVHKEGTIAFKCKADKDADWYTNDKRYYIVRDQFGPIQIQVIKYEDCTLEVMAAGPLWEVFKTRKPLPESDNVEDVHISVTWKAPSVIFYFNGQAVDTVNVGD